ncbi:unnamed protein product [Pleuronectes platessa]|uniref:Uncharacterized protein n=1 Tax=Pleuronectes platessa TaxID=8262 RepID=A0A9N7UQ87_PLEPL|nr:unnamed protein product [Pleuronectes platessa]
MSVLTRWANPTDCRRKYTGCRVVVAGESIGIGRFPLHTGLASAASYRSWERGCATSLPGFCNRSGRWRSRPGSQPTHTITYSHRDTEEDEDVLKTRFCTYMSGGGGGCRGESHGPTDTGARAATQRNRCSGAARFTTRSSAGFYGFELCPCSSGKAPVTPCTVQRRVSRGGLESRRPSEAPSGVVIRVRSRSIRDAGDPNCLPVPNEVPPGLREEAQSADRESLGSRRQKVAVAGRRLYAAKWWKSAAATK